MHTSSGSPDFFAKEKETSARSIEEGTQLLEIDFKIKETSLFLPQIKVNENYQIRWNSHWHSITRWGFENLLKLIGIPPKFGLSISPDLLVYNIEKLKGKRSKPIVALFRKGNIINFCKQPFYPAKNVDVLRMFQKNLEKWDFESLKISDRGISLSLIKKELKPLEPKVGDPTKIGLRTINSETGWRSLKASFLLFRLACRNGAVLPQDWGTVRWSYDHRMRYATSLSLFEQGIVNFSLKQRKLLGQVYKRLPERNFTDEQFIKLWRAVKRVVGNETADRILDVESSKRNEILRRIRERKKENKLRSSSKLEPVEIPWNIYTTYNRITTEAKNYNYTEKESLETIAGKLIRLAG